MFTGDAVVLELLFPNHVWIFQQLDRSIIRSQFYEGYAIDKCHFVSLLCYRLGDIFESVHKASCCRCKCGYTSSAAISCIK